MNHLVGDIDAQHASFRRFRRRRTLIIIAALAAIFALLIWQIGRLRPPSSLRLATGPEGEHEYAVAQLYQRFMAEQGVALEIVPTTGSLETIGLLQSGAVDAGFMLNAANFEVDADGLVGLASVGHVPVWIFYRDDLETDGSLQDLSDLRGLRVSLGAPLSGTRAVSKLLFGIAQVSEDDLDVVEAGPEESVDMLRNGEVDAILMVSGVNSQTLLDLLLDPTIEIMDFRLAETYKRLIPFLHTVELLEGSLNLTALEPAEDKRLLTDATVLIANEDLHPDLQVLLLLAAEATQRQSAVLFPAGDVFPSINDLTLPVSETTRRYLTEGETILQRYLPFWIASPMERFYLLILPVLFLLYPLVRNTPTAYSAFMRRRVYVYYKRLREMELGLSGYSIADLERQIVELETLQQELTDTLHVPTGYLQSFYNLRVHMRLVIDRLTQRQQYLTSLGLQPDELPPDAPIRAESEQHGIANDSELLPTN